MAKKTKSVSVLICSIVSVILTFFSPLVVRVIEKPLGGYSTKYISLFDGFAFPAVKVFLLVFGAGLILSALVYLFSDSGKVVSLIRSCSFFFLVSQVLAVLLSIGAYYSDSSLLGTIKISIGDMVFTPQAAIACIFSLITFVLSLFCKKG